MSIQKAKVEFYSEKRKILPSRKMQKIRENTENIVKYVQDATTAWFYCQRKKLQELQNQKEWYENHAEKLSLEKELTSQQKKVKTCMDVKFTDIEEIVNQSELGLLSRYLKHTLQYSIKGRIKDFFHATPEETASYANRWLSTSFMHLSAPKINHYYNTSGTRINTYSWLKDFWAECQLQPKELNRISRAFNLQSRINYLRFLSSNLEYLKKQDIENPCDFNIRIHNQIVRDFNKDTYLRVDKAYLEKNIELLC